MSRRWILWLTCLVVGVLAACVPDLDDALDDDDATSDDDATGDDDSSQQEDQAPCAVFVPTLEIAAGQALLVRVSMEPPCEGINWVLTPTYSVNGQTITIDASWEYEVIDDDGMCCGNVQNLDVTGLTPGTYTINAACHSAYAEECAEDSFPAQDFVQSATVLVTN